MGESETGEEQIWILDCARLVTIYPLASIDWWSRISKDMLVLHITTWLMSQGDEAGSSKCLKQQVSEKQEIHWWEVLYREWQGSRCYQDPIVCS